MDIYDETMVECQRLVPQLTPFIKDAVYNVIKLKHWVAEGIIKPEELKDFVEKHIALSIGKLIDIICTAGNE